MKSSKDDRANFRPLQRADPEQTTAQWLENLIKLIQEESGELAKFMELDSRPSDPGDFPEEPLKPTAELMPFMIEAFKIANNMSTDPTPLDIWSKYQRDMTKYVTAKALHGIAWKMYHETFPKINEDCFKVLQVALTEPQSNPCYTLYWGSKVLKKLSMKRTLSNSLSWPSPTSTARAQPQAPTPMSITRPSCSLPDSQKVLESMSILLNTLD